MHKGYRYAQILKDSDLQHGCHEDGAAHEGEDHEAGKALLSDAEELGLLPGGRALGLQLQAVNVTYGEDGGCYEPGQAHQRAHAQHHPHHEQVQVVPAAFLDKGKAPVNQVEIWNRVQTLLN